MPRKIWFNLVPVAAAVIALAALAAIPWTADWRLARIRLDTVETVAPARRLMSQFASAVALDAATTRNEADGTTPERTRRHDEALRTERSSDAELLLLAPRLGETLERDIVHLHAVIAQWNAQRSVDPNAADESLANVMTSAALLDSALARRQEQQRTRIRSLESMDVLLPSVLVPLLIAVLLGIYWTGRRMAALAAQAEEGRRALAAASEERVTLVRGLTHDLKNGLGAASGFATLLREEISGPLTARQHDHVERIGRIIEQTIAAAENALTVARAEAGSLPVRRHQEDIRALILESAADYVAAAERAGLTLRAEFTEDLPCVETDPSLVSNIIGDLLSNAIKYTPKGGHIWLRASSRDFSAHERNAGHWVVAEVRDTGPGIPAALREQVFDEFFRAPDASAATAGQGIGLSMSRRVARLLGGDLTLASEEGKGSTFTLWLPGPSSPAMSPRAVA
ncbi:MAG: ATP-binding region ATPase domain protein [Gemmatimonadetes bacterium]|nr:ATP-binding region ATPase domain protein [Gemmatimonadota bacterium]